MMSANDNENLKAKLHTERTRRKLAEASLSEMRALLSEVKSVLFNLDPKDGREYGGLTATEISAKRLLSSYDLDSDYLNKVRDLEREVEVLRHYGNKDCIAMADEVLRKERANA